MSSILIAVVTGTPKIETDFPSGFHVIAGVVLPFSVFSVTTKILKKEAERFEMPQLQTNMHLIDKCNFTKIMS